MVGKEKRAGWVSIKKGESDTQTDRHGLVRDLMVIGY